VSEVGFWEDTEWSWRLRWRRSRFEWESIMKVELMNLIIGKSPRKEAEDVMVWNGDSNGVFSLKSEYQTLCQSPNGISHDGYSLLWQVKALPKALFTAWRVLIGRLSTYENLTRRGMVVNSTLCVLCKAAEESNHHLFLTCIFAQKVWSLCLRWIGILFVQHKDLMNHFESFYLVHLSFKQNQVWKGVWVAIIWSIWKQRNLVVFKQRVVMLKKYFT